MKLAKDIQDNDIVMIDKFPFKVLESFGEVKQVINGVQVMVIALLLKDPFKTGVQYFKPDDKLATK